MSQKYIASLLLAIGCNAAHKESRINESYVLTPEAGDSEATRGAKSSTLEKLKGAEYAFAKLPTKVARRQRPWPAYYWPWAKGGITARSDQAPSPIEKFELAYGLELVRLNPGYRRGDIGRAIQRYIRENPSFQWWQGICHGSAEAALFFPEPESVVQIGEIQFTSHEIKGLLSYFLAEQQDYAEVFSGSQNEDAVKLDRSGRPLQASFRDLNPGLFHLLLTNFLQDDSSSGWVIDIDPGEPVLLFPVYQFEVQSTYGLNSIKQMHPRLFDQYGKYQYASSDRQLIGVRASLLTVDNHFVQDRRENHAHELRYGYEYILELDQDGRIVGGEWVGESTLKHPDFIYSIASRADRVGSLRYFENKLEIWPILKSLLAASVQ